MILNGFFYLLFLLSCQQNITDACMKTVSDHCRELTFVSVSGCEALTDITLRYLGEGCPELK